MKNGQLSTEMTSAERSDDVTDDAVGEAEADGWTADNDGGDGTAERGDGRTSCV